VHLGVKSNSKLGAGKTAVSIPVAQKKRFHPPEVPDRCWGPPILTIKDIGVVSLAYSDRSVKLTNTRNVVQTLRFLIASLSTASDHLPLGASNRCSLFYVSFRCFLGYYFLLHCNHMTHPLESSPTANPS